MAPEPPCPEPPYYAVIFSAQRTATDTDYAETDQRMVELVRQQPGFLGVESLSSTTGRGITISYWRNLEDIANWRNHVEHAAAQAKGRQFWYASYDLHVAEVVRTHRWQLPNTVARPGLDNRPI